MIIFAVGLSFNPIAGFERDRIIGFQWTLRNFSLASLDIRLKPDSWATAKSPYYN